MKYLKFIFKKYALYKVSLRIISDYINIKDYIFILNCINEIFE